MRLMHDKTDQSIDTADAAAPSADINEAELGSLVAQLAGVDPAEAPPIADAIAERLEAELGTAEADRWPSGVADE